MDLEPVPSGFKDELYSCITAVKNDVCAAFHSLIPSELLEKYNAWLEEWTTAMDGPKRALTGYEETTQDPTVIHYIEVGLEEIYHGCTKKMSVVREIFGADGTVESEQKTLIVEIEPGCEYDTRIIFPNASHIHPGRVPADIAFVIKEKTHPTFKREGANLRFVYDVPLRNALCGFFTKFPTIDGESVHFNAMQTIKPGSEEKFTGQGLPDPKSDGKRGDLIIEFNVCFPDALSSESIHMVKEALPSN